MKEGHAYAGMNIGAHERARSLTALVPALTPDALAGLQDIVDGALSVRAPRHDDGLCADPPCPSPLPPSGNAGRKTGVSRNRPPHSAGDGSRAKAGRLEQSPDSKAGPIAASCTAPPGIYPSPQALPLGLPPPGTHDPLADLAPLCELTPALGYGKVNIVDSGGTRRTQACAASSIVQLLCAEYKRPATDALAADIAAAVQKLTSVSDGTPLEASDVWWVALTEMFPNGPWPGLVVIYAPNGCIQRDLVRLMRIPGPVDDRLFMILGDGRHFDPVWWQTPEGQKAAVPALPGVLANVEVTLEPDIGPAAGALLLFRASHIGFLPPPNLAGGTCPGDHGGAVMNGGDDWRAWWQYAEHRHRLTIDNWESTVVVMLQCKHPVTPYPEVLSVAQGVNMLAPVVQVAHIGAMVSPTAPPTLFIFALDSEGCHVGTLPPSRAGDALTWLHNPAAPRVTIGHPGP